MFQLGQNDSLDQETLTKIHNEFRARNVSILELKHLQQQYDASYEALREQLETNEWDPFYTAFAWKRHFKHISLLKTQGNKLRAKQYQLRFYVGIAVYMLLAILLILLIR